MDQLQHFNVPISAMERFELFCLFQDDLTLKTVVNRDREQGKAYRRMLSAFGIMPIRDAVTKASERAAGARRIIDLVNQDQVTEELRIFNITVENLAALERFYAVPWNGNRELILGQLDERLQAARKGAMEEDWL